ncbi:MAG: hypothetical protein OHK93_001269, partial [Ramalina farinacea]|nr:hypothetical protein [Ramalina farinacea]
MEFHIVFKVKLRAHGEVSPAFIQRLRVTKQYIDQVFGPSNATVRDEADVSYEQIQANGIDHTEGWDLTCRQPVFVDDSNFSYG